MAEQASSFGLRASGFGRADHEQNQASGFGLQASGEQIMSTEDRAELVAHYGESIRGLKSLRNAIRPQPEARSLKPEAGSLKSEARSL